MPSKKDKKAQNFDSSEQALDEVGNPIGVEEEMPIRPDKEYRDEEEFTGQDDIMDWMDNDEEEESYDSEFDRHEQDVPYGAGFDLEGATNLVSRIVALAGWLDRNGYEKHANTMDKVLASVTKKFIKMAQAASKHNK